MQGRTASFSLARGCGKIWILNIKNGVAMTEKRMEHKILSEKNHESFISRNRISLGDWERAGCDWSTLQEIARDHEVHFLKLATTAEFIAKTIQSFPNVHSVRWRVKDTEHLIEKIVRKRANPKSSRKYKNINSENYNKIITDLIGVRALHLFKDDCIEIHDELLAMWKPVEKPIAYTRKGDHEEFIAKLKERGLIAKDHSAGYRSLHYVVESKPTNREIRAEIQVRTLFEEGWSEIDHTVRYPNFMNDELTNYLLTIFNRMAGSADEMGGFVRQLALALQTTNESLRVAIAENDLAKAKIDATIIELDQSRNNEEKYKKLSARLKTELNNLDKTTSLHNHLSQRSGRSSRKGANLDYLPGVSPGTSVLWSRSPAETHALLDAARAQLLHSVLGQHIAQHRRYSSKLSHTEAEKIARAARAEVDKIARANSAKAARIAAEKAARPDAAKAERANTERMSRTDKANTINAAGEKHVRNDASPVDDSTLVAKNGSAEKTHKNTPDGPINDNQGDKK